MPTFLGLLLSFTALLLIIIVLIQRGRGGGLAGALGGGGGQSAFGTKAGDLFTKITVCLAFFWIVLCIITLRVLSASGSKFTDDTTAGQTAPENPGDGSTAPTGGDKGDKAAGTDKSKGATTPGAAAKPDGAAKPDSGAKSNATPPATSPPATSKPATPPATPAAK